MWSQARRLFKEWRERHKYDDIGFVVALLAQLPKRNDYAPKE